MAVSVTVQGNQLKIEKDSNKPVYINMDDVMPVISGDHVSIRDNSNKTNGLSSTLFSDFTTPSGASAIVVADAIAALSGAMVPGGGGGTSDVNVIELGGNAISTGTGSSDAGTQRVEVVDDQPNLPQFNLADASAEATVPASATAVTLIAANTSRKEVIIRNDSTTGTLYVRKGSGATTTDAIKLLPSADGVNNTIIDDYDGIITGIWDIASGNARISETTKP